MTDTILDTPELVEAGRAYLVSGFGDLLEPAERAELAASLTPAQVAIDVDRYYPGGIDAFVADHRAGV